MFHYDITTEDLRIIANSIDGVENYQFQSFDTLKGVCSPEISITPLQLSYI